jgi:hypothetical protein
MKRLKLPMFVEIVQGPWGPRFRGPAFALKELIEPLRSLQHAPIGMIFCIESIELYVSYSPDDPQNKGRVALPPDAWNILACKFNEVVYGYEETPFDFGDCGYLSMPALDLGIELVGKPGINKIFQSENKITLKLDKNLLHPYKNLAFIKNTA